MSKLFGLENYRAWATRNSQQVSQSRSVNQPSLEAAQYRLMHARLQNTAYKEMLVNQKKPSSLSSSIDDKVLRDLAPESDIQTTSSSRAASSMKIAHENTHESGVVDKTDEKILRQETDETFHSKILPQDPVRKIRTQAWTGDHVQELLSLRDSVAKAVDVNSKFFVAKGFMNEKVDESEKMRRKKRSEEIKKRKQKISELVKSVERKIEKMPMWKHRLRGEWNPPESAVFKGAALFKTIAWSCTVLILRPLLSIKKRKLATRDRERADLEKTLSLYAETCDAWLAKSIKVPFISIEQDPTLDFNPHEYVGSGRGSLAHRMMQMKIRVKAVINGVISAGLPPEHITDFLVTLMEDDNYFMPTFLWECEKRRLLFNDIGATRGMLMPIDVGAGEEASTANSSMDAKGTAAVKLAIHSVSIGSGDQSRTLDASRAKMLIKDFLLVRILISHLALSPWHYGMCHQPRKRVAKVVYNCRLVASLLYEIVKLSSPYLPEVQAADVMAPGVATVASSFMSREGDGEAARDGSGEVADSISTRLPNNNSRDVDSTDGSMGSLLTNCFQLARAFEEWGSQSMSKADGGSNSEVEAKVLQAREVFCPLPELHRLLLRRQVFSAVQDKLDHWLPVFAKVLDTWVDSVVQHVLNRRLQKTSEAAKLKDGVEEDVETEDAKYSSEERSSSAVVPPLALKGLGGDGVGVGAVGAGRRLTNRTAGHKATL